MVETRSELIQKAKIVFARKRLQELEYSRECEESLYKFLEGAWQYIDPSPFVGGWHLEAICEHLQAVNDGHIRRLLINIPPRMSKSSTVSVAWPAWTWIQQSTEYSPLSGPKAQFLFASYAETLAVRDSVKTRRLIQSPWYQKNWGSRFVLTEDQNTKTRFENNFNGYRLSTSVGGTLTGEGGSILCVDDAHKADEVESELIRKGVIDWYDEVFSTRLNNPKEGAIVIIGQRVHEEDISGHLLDLDTFTHLNLPMEYEEGRRCVTVLGIDHDTKEKVLWADPRESDGELLCEGRYGPDEIEEQKKKPFVWAGQFQQRPAPKGGAIIKEEYWQHWGDQDNGGKYPPFEYLIASLDTAYGTKQENDPSAMTIWGLFRDESNNPKVMLIWAWQERLGFPELCQKVIDFCTIDERKVNHPRFPVDRLLIEGKASGKSVAQELYRAVSLTGKLGIQVVDDNKGKWTPDKVARVHSITHLFTDHMVYAPDRAFADMVKQQCAVFPRGSHDDLVDTVSMALRYLRDTGFALSRQESSMLQAEEMTLKRKTAILYPV